MTTLSIADIAGVISRVARDMAAVGVSAEMSWRLVDNSDGQGAAPSRDVLLVSFKGHDVVLAADLDVESLCARLADRLHEDLMREAAGPEPQVSGRVLEPQLYQGQAVWRASDSDFSARIGEVRRQLAEN